MICNRCGTQFSDDSDFCPNCGMIAANSEPQLAFSTDAAAYENVEIKSKPNYDGFPMNWYKFLIYFALFAGAILNVISGIFMIFGFQYGSNAQLYFSTYPSLKLIDIIFGCLTVLLGAYLLYVRFELAKLKKGAPIKLLISYGLNFLISASYLIVTTVLTSTDVGLDLGIIGPEIFSLVLSSVVIIYFNKIYFDKRESLFVN